MALVKIQRSNDEDLDKERAANGSGEPHVSSSHVCGSVWNVVFLVFIRICRFRSRHESFSETKVIRYSSSGRSNHVAALAADNEARSICTGVLLMSAENQEGSRCGIDIPGSIVCILLQTASVFLLALRTLGRCESNNAGSRKASWDLWALTQHLEALFRSITLSLNSWKSTAHVSGERNPIIKFHGK